MSGEVTSPGRNTFEGPLTGVMPFPIHTEMYQPPQGSADPTPALLPLSTGEWRDPVHVHEGTMCPFVTEKLRVWLLLDVLPFTLLWTELCPCKIHAEALTPNVMVCGACREVMNVKGGYRVGS